MLITPEELARIALKLIEDNQNNFSASDDSHESLLYSLSYNDGVLDLMNAIAEEKKGELI